MLFLKTLLVIAMYGLSLQLNAYTLEGKVKTNSYLEASNRKNHISFDFKSTKIAIIGSNHRGFAGHYTYFADVDFIKSRIKNMNITIYSYSLLTDEPDRDEKLQNYCLQKDKYPQIEVSVKGPLLIDNKNYVLPGKMKILNKEHIIDVNLKAKMEKGQLMIEGLSHLNINKLNIPDPSIFIAKLDPEIKINLLVLKDIK